jgi:aspartyl protease
MPHWRSFAIGIQQPTLGQFAVALAPDTLANLGCNLLVEVATASAFTQNPTTPMPRHSAQVMAHLDTGARRTNISTVLAQQLGLVQMGVGSSQTANGPASNPTYAIDLLFVGTALAARINLMVDSCTLPFTPSANATDPRNFAVLIGRDLMEAWHLAWDGPTSTIFISE